MNRTLAIAYGLIRPPFAVLLALCAAVGVVQTGHLPTVTHQIAALVAIVGWMFFSVAVNDLADERIDQVNLGTDARRVLVSGIATRHQVVALAVGGATTALCAAAILGPSSLAVVACGLALAGAYSLPPFRLSGRGTLTAALLPLGYVAVPYLIGTFSTGAGIDTVSPLLLAGLYLGFMGRLVLKDFRDEHGDKLYGKRTMLVRHGRVRTCVFSGVFWAAGAGVTLCAFTERPVLATALVAYVVAALAMLADMTRDRCGVRDIANIAAIASVGRALICTVLIQFATSMQGWTPVDGSLIVALTALTSLGMAAECRRGLLPVADPLTERERRELPHPSAFPVPACNVVLV